MVSPIGELEVPGDPPLPAGVPASQIQGRSPWYLAWLRLRRNKVALVCGVLFVLIVLFCLAAPLWAERVAHTGPNANHITEKVMINGEPTNVVATDGTPIGPGLRGQFLLGADQNGRDVMVRLMYGGRASLSLRPSRPPRPPRRPVFASLLPPLLPSPAHSPLPPPT